MPIVGPELPPHLATKRKHQEADNEESAESTRLQSASRSPNNDGSDKRRRVMGPSLPPASLEELPTTASNLDSDTDSDGDLGPSLPPPPGQYDYEAETRRSEAVAAEAAAREKSKKPQREEWMLVPPKQDDWASKVDPTKLRNRKFNTGKGAKAPAQKGAADNTIWTETPEEKRKRLKDEVMGVKKPAHLDQESHKSSKSEAESRETERRIREYNEKHRGSSLYSEHKKTVPKEKEDDPSKRAFDKEKDIGLAVKIGHAQKKELMNRAADFGSRFARGNYL